MTLPGISSTVLVGALVLATPAHAVGKVDFPGFHDAPSSGARATIALAEAALAQAGEPQGDGAESEPDWLAAPVDPDRHTLWVPTLEWGIALGLTIPLFMIDPAFVNTGEFSSRHFAEAWTKGPEWDTDGWVANYVLHPLMGAEAYLTVRNRDYGPITSLLFSTGVSVAWEFLFEAWVERPSTQDLILTSTVGSLFGELRFMARTGLSRHDPSFIRDALIVLVDPIEAIHRFINAKFLDDPDDVAGAMMIPTLDVGPDQARLMLTLRF